MIVSAERCLVLRKEICIDGIVPYPHRLKSTSKLAILRDAIGGGDVFFTDLQVCREYVSEFSYALHEWYSHLKVNVVFPERTTQPLLFEIKD